MDFLLLVLLLLLCTRLAGELFRRAGHAPLIGEVLAGILLGPAVLAVVDSPPPPPPLIGEARAGILPGPAVLAVVKPSRRSPRGAVWAILVRCGILFLVLSA